MFVECFSQTTYHIAPSGGDYTAWSGVPSLSPGDSVLYQKGHTYSDIITIGQSGTSGNPIVIGAYGTGENPIIDGADVITGLTDEGSNIWQKTVVTIQPNLMYLNGTVGTPQTSLGACTSEGDWFWDSATNILYVYSANGDPSGNIELGQRGILVDASNRSNITLRSLTIQHSNNNNTIGYPIFRGAVYMYQGSYLTLSECTIKDNSLHGLHVLNSSHLTIDNNTFLRNGLTNNNGDNTIIAASAAGVTDITYSNNNSSYAGHNGCLIYSEDAANRITNIDIHGNTFTYDKAAGAYTVKGDSVAIYNNIFDSNGDAVAVGEDYAIGVQSCDNIDIYQNTITNQLNNDAVQIYGGVHYLTGASETSNNVRVFSNFISGVTNGDCLQLSPNDSITMLNAQVFNNVLANASTQGLVLSHDGDDYVDTVFVYNNTFYGNGKDIYKYIAVPLVIKNNIFSYAFDTSVKTSPGGEPIISSHNLWYRSSGDVLEYNGSKYTTATITNFEVNRTNRQPAVYRYRKW